LTGDSAAWNPFLSDFDARGPRRPEFVIVDGAPGLEAALVALWGADLPIQRYTGPQAQEPLGECAQALA
jgi:transposase-like protein